MCFDFGVPARPFKINLGNRPGLDVYSQASGRSRGPSFQEAPLSSMVKATEQAVDQHHALQGTSGGAPLIEFLLRKHLLSK